MNTSFGITTTIGKSIGSQTETYFAENGESKHKILKITRIFTSEEAIPKVVQRDLAEMQAKLVERGIPLNCEHPPRQEHLNDFRPGAVQSYLSQIQLEQPSRYERLKTFFERDVLKLTVDELEDKLPRCTKYLDSKVKGGDYQIGFVKRKSLKWIAELALPYMSCPPIDYFEPSTDVGGSQTELSKKSSDFVVFDDASYSGKQMITIISSMLQELLRQDRKGKIYFVIPFVSKVAEASILHHLQTLMTSPELHGHEGLKRLKIHLITSERQVKTMKDIFPEGLDSIGITFTEWKVPDTHSLSCIVSGGGPSAPELLTNYPPCYKW
jgi:hypothetical protein